MAKKKQKKKEQKQFSVSVVVKNIHFYRVWASSAKEAKRLFANKEGNGIEFVTKVRKLEDDITVEEI